MKLSQADIEKRVHLSETLFLDGYNCAQAVWGAIADLYGVEQNDALKMSAGFGGGMGRLRLTCGAVSGMVMAAGYENGQTKPNDPEQKLINYRLVQDLSHQFQQEHGSLICSELLAMRAARLKEQSTVDSSTSPVPAERNEAYYHQRPCLVQITSAVRIYCEQYNRLHP